MPHNWDETWRWLVALGGIVGIYRLAVFLNDCARGAKSRTRHPTTWRHWFMLPLMPLMPFISTASLAFWGLSLLAVWVLRKAWPLLPVGEPPVLAHEDKVRRKTVGPIRYPFWSNLRGQAGWVWVAVEITSDGAYRAHRVLGASPPAIFDRAVALAVAGTTYETHEPGPLPEGIEALYRFEPRPPRPRPGRALAIAPQAQV
jgi:hypothetical protein